MGSASKRASDRLYRLCHKQDPAQVRAARARYKKKFRSKEARKWLQDLKEQTPCADCGLYYPWYVMDFDHVGKKTAEISDLRHRATKERILREIAQCQLVCSNCHRIRTHKRKQYISVPTSQEDPQMSLLD